MGAKIVSGLISDKRIVAKVKGKVYKRMVRPAILFDLETVAPTKRKKTELEVAELTTEHH